MKAIKYDCFIARLSPWCQKKKKKPRSGINTGVLVKQEKWETSRPTETWIEGEQSIQGLERYIKHRRRYSLTDQLRHLMKFHVLA